MHTNIHETSQFKSKCWKRTQICMFSEEFSSIFRMADFGKKQNKTKNKYLKKVFKSTNFQFESTENKCLKDYLKTSKSK